MIENSFKDGAEEGLHLLSHTQTLTTDRQRQHNLRLPVSRLPPEILSNIFFNLRDNFITRQPRIKHGLQCLVGWIGVTHVCHTWREIALNTPLLWSHVDVFISFGPWISELLLRSKGSPITMVVPLHNGPLDEVEKHFGRVRELVLDLPHEDTLRTIFSSPSNFRILETLEIIPFEVFGRMGPFKCRFVLNDACLDTQRLRTLNLNGCSINWNSRFLQGLTHLKLEHIPHRCALGVSDFALVLSKIPALETLHLSNFFYDIGQVKAVKVHLRHLRELLVESRAPAIAQFLPCLVIPRSCKIDISSGNDSDEISDEFRVILSWVSNRLSVPTTRPLACSDASDDGQYIRTLHFVHIPETVDSTVEGYYDVLSHEQLETADPILRFTVWWTYLDVGNFFQTFFPLFSLDGVVVIDAATNFGEDLSPEFWLGVFGSIETLTTVYLNTTTSNFWEALTPANPDNGVIPFSALSSVTVEDRNLDFQLVLNTLRLRSQLGGTQLQDLHFICNGDKPSAAIITQLGDLVPRIEFMDSIADGESDEDYE